MWADNAIVNKLLTRLLRCLLVCHLCPEQDRTFKAKKKDLQDNGKGKGKQVLRDTNASIPLHAISLINMTRNSRRRLFRKEEKKLAKYQSKGNTTAAERCQVRLDTYREMLARKRQKRDQHRQTQLQQQAMASGDVEDQLAQEEIEVEKSQDISKRRLGKLVQVARSALFSRDAISPAYVNKKLKQETKNKINVVRDLPTVYRTLLLISKRNNICFGSNTPFKVQLISLSKLDIYSLSITSILFRI